MYIKSIQGKRFWLLSCALSFPLDFLFIFLYFLVHIAGYESVEKQTKGSEKVFYDFKKVCNRGDVRYLLASARQKLPGFTVTDDFAAAVCSLSEEYDQDKYFNFIERWGTVSVLSLNFI